MKRKKNYVLAILTVAVLLTGLFPGVVFAQDRAMQGKAQALKELHLFAGTNRGDDLDRAPTRLESAVMLIRLLGAEQEARASAATHPFTDVPKWGDPYISYAYKKGLVRGISKTEFGAKQKIDSSEFLTLTLRALGYKNIAPKHAAEAARTAGIVTSDLPLTPFTRGSAVSICYAALKAPMAGGGERLADKLIAKGVFTSKMLASAEQTALHPKQSKFPIVKDYKFYVPIKGSGEKIVYLTFDDGPSEKVTPRILDILKENDVKATFFVLGSAAERNPQLVKRAYDEGHVIANHSYSHNYKTLYESTDNLAWEIEMANKSINAALGFDYGNRLFRFPGGSSGKSEELKDAVYDLGYQYVDWNSSSEDAASKKGSTAEAIKNSAINTAGKKKEVTVLFHDTVTKSTTADALPSVIQYFKEQGYTFKTLAE